ncbi:hypothetical protein NQ176_g5633 [Zarea fungicola]|uniref:Uncharacterized protein n=1 Tax=Zarea fungicola TaxID=93591 RepID=A0ACC1N9V1_9HYPO|nr:hypothetical protein NQ176_g5633 [Lecanicillium fungicola]
MASVSIPFYDDGSARERATFHIYRTQTIESISGSFDRDFWDISVAQSMKSYEAVWHAALAVAALYERSRINCGTELAAFFRDRYYETALCQYGKSIRSLNETISRKALTASDKEAILTTNALYTAICNLQGDTRAANIHVSNGIRLFRLWRIWAAAQPSKGEGTAGPNPFMAIFYRFIGFQMYTGNLTSSEAHEMPELAELAGSQQLGTTRLAQDMAAYYEIHAIFISTLSRLVGTKGSTKPTKNEEPFQEPQADLLYDSRCAFTHWKTKYSRLMAAFDRTSSFYVLSLQARVIGTEILLKVDPKGLGKNWETLTHLLLKGIDVSEQLLTLEKEAVNNEGKDFDSPVLSFAASACDLLFVVGLAGRDREIAFNALSLLKTWPRKDKTWTTALGVQILQARLDVEDTGSTRYACKLLPTPGGECIPGGYVCTAHRVSQSTVQFTGNREGLLAVKTVAEEYLKLPGTTMRISW